MPGTTFDPRKTYIHLAPSGASEVDTSGDFWGELASGQRDYPGRLAMVLPMTGDFPHWERHPAGEELVMMLSGTMDLILEEDAGERTVRIGPGEAVLVPTGVWHRGVIIEPGEALFVTEGEGTDHKPVEDRP
ncbi:cupin domain-containing protein [Maricaulis sp.]|uniref:cupin domain-containing protein n=1 Tax=Maricaulis sp. TaxID=1486257 RepID=UPI0032975D5D